MDMKKNIAKFVVGGLVAAGALTACSSQADTVSNNLSKDADSYKITRQIVFYNGITGQYVAEVTGRCSIGNNDDAGKLSYTCKVGDDQYIKNYLGLSDNVTWFALQVKPAHSDPYHYEVIFKPEEIIPDVQLQTSGGN
jgi:hypothetical protein